MKHSAVSETASEMNSPGVRIEGGGEMSRPAAPLASELHGSAHSVHFYNTDAFLVEEVSAFLGTALAAGEAAIVVASPAHRRGVASELGARGLSLAKLVRQGRYVELDAAETFEKISVDGMPDTERFSKVIGGAILRANAAGRANPPRAAVFGEMVALLWASGKTLAARELERLWNSLAGTHAFTLRCAYPISGFSRTDHVAHFLKICDLHSSVLPTENYIKFSSEEERLRALSEWQQKAQVLDRRELLSLSELSFRLFAGAVQDCAIFFLDTSGHVSTWNPGAERIKGYKASEIIGKHFSCFYPEEDIRSRKPDNELEVAGREGRFEDEGWRLRKDGSRFWANVIITAIRSDTGQLLGFAKITRDFTERMQAQEALRRKNAELGAEVAERKLAEDKLAASEQSLRELSIRLLRSQDEERKRIGRDLHDSLGQYLAMLKLSLETIEPGLPSEPQEIAERFAQCIRLADDSIKEVRTLSYLLYPPMLEQTGLKSAISWYLDGFSNRSNIQIGFDADPNFGRVSRDIELALFRVLQESLTNVHRHSGSATANVRLCMANGQAILQVVDSGKGIPAEVLDRLNGDSRGSWGVGLRGMKERLGQLGGKLEILSTANGTTLTASVPAGPPVSE